MRLNTKEAIILCGGRGTRLSSVVSDVPKPLAPVGDRPFLFHILDRLAEEGFEHVILATGYMSSKIEDAVGPKWREMDISYSVEESPLGTGGAIKKACSARNSSTDGIHVLNGDTWLEYPPGALEQVTLRSSSRIGMALAHVPDLSRYGAIHVMKDRVETFVEKGRNGPGLINAGCYFLLESAIARFPLEGVFSFEDDFLKKEVECGAVAALSDTAAFIDIGVPEDYAHAQSIFEHART